MKIKTTIQNILNDSKISRISPKVYVESFYRDDKAIRVAGAITLIDKVINEFKIEHLDKNSATRAAAIDEVSGDLKALFKEYQGIKLKSGDQRAAFIEAVNKKFNLTSLDILDSAEQNNNAFERGLVFKEYLHEAIRESLTSAAKNGVISVSKLKSEFCDNKDSLYYKDKKGDDKPLFLDSDIANMGNCIDKNAKHIAFNYSRINCMCR